MAYGRATRAEARTLFVHSRLPVASVALKIGVPQATVSRWKSEARGDGDDWDIARSAATMAGEGFEAVISSAVEEFTVMFQTTMIGLKEDPDLKHEDKAKLMASLADSFSKIVKAAGRASPKIAKLGVAIFVLKALAEFIKDRFPEHADAFQDVLEPFGVEISRSIHEAE